MRKWGASFVKSQRNGSLQRAAETLRCGKEEQLLTEVGYGKITAADVADVVIPEDQRKTSTKRTSDDSDNPFGKLLRKVTRRGLSSGIRVQGQDDILVRCAGCCSPLPGDQIVGFITRGRGVTIHTRECPKALDLDPDRRVDVSWDDRSKTQHSVTLQVVCADAPGLLAHISQAFTDSGVNISQAHCRATEDRRAVNTFHASVSNLNQLKTVIRSLSGIKGVYAVDRVRPGE